jgi:hypothetical protein
MWRTGGKGRRSRRYSPRSRRARMDTRLALTNAEFTPGTRVQVVRYRAEDVKEPVPLEWTPCNFGGERPWFVCPGDRCGRRVAILYGPGKYFLCRNRYDLRYESQREDKKNRALRRAQKIRTRLSGSANMMEPFPDKPKGMHHDTYMRLFKEHYEAETEHLTGLREWLDELQKRIA